MGLRKGKTNNPNGRPPGVPNRITRELREILKTFVAEELEGLPERIRTLNEKDRVELLIKLLPYVLPKVESVSHSYGEPMDLEGIINFE